MKQEHSKIKSDILLRVRLLYIVFFLVAAIVLVRLVWVQLFSREVSKNAENLSGRIFIIDTLHAHKGSILARGGEPLASSLFGYQVMFDFASEGLDSMALYHEQSDSLAKLLAAFFKDRPAAEYSRVMRQQRDKHYYFIKHRDTTYRRSSSWLGRLLDRLQDKEYVTRRICDTVREKHDLVPLLPRKVDYAEWEILRRYPLLNMNMGVVYRLEVTDQRIYPQDALARRTIGLKGDRGNYGIENAYHEYLDEHNGWATFQRIAPGYRGRVAGESQEPRDGLDVVTTIDLDIQDVADRILRERLTEQNAIWGTTIVMEVATGELLALVNLGRNDDGSYTERENYALGRSMEPGSTFKLTSMLTLLDDAKMPPSKMYQTHDGNKVDIGPAKNIYDSHRGDHEIALRRAVAGSSNVYFAKAIWEYYGITGKKQQYSDYLRNNLHLGQTVGLENMGERPPMVTADWKVPDPGIMLVKMAYGYRIRLAPIQTITLYNAIANNGRMISPKLVREIRRGDRVEESFDTHTIDRAICSQPTLRLVTDYLQDVCKTGTASQFFSDTTRLRVAAKTGTAQVTNTSDGYLGSMVAFFPADKPRYTVLTVIETRRQPGKQYYGGPLAGPVVKRVVDYIHNRESSTAVAQQGARRYPEEFKGGEIEQVRRMTKQLAADVSFDQRSGWGRVRVDSLSRASITALPDASATMPDVRGMGLKDALFLLENRGLNVRATGQGAVAEQSIAPGTALTSNLNVTITLR